MPTEKPRLMVTMEPADRRELDAMADRMHMRTSTFAAWLLTNVVRNLDAAETVAAVIQKVQHSPPVMDAAPGAGKRKTRTRKQPGSRKR